MSAAVIWRKSSTKDVRPFFGAVALESCLEGAEIRLYEDSAYEAETAFIIEPHQVEKLCISVKPNFIPEELAYDAIKRKDLVLAITACQPFLKKTCLIGRLPLSAKLPEEIAVGDEVLAQLGGGSHINVELALCLATQLPQKPGIPFLSGHWLSKKTFALRPTQPAEDFDVSPRDDEDWIRIGYPAKTAYLIEFYGGMNEPAAADKQMAKAWVHSDIFKKLGGEASQRLAKPVMTAMGAEMTCQLLVASFSEWEHATEVVPQSPLAAFVKKFSRFQPCTLDDLKTMVKQAGTPKLRALIHADQQTVRSIKES
jgi:hypothetical protein